IDFHPFRLQTYSLGRRQREVPHNQVEPENQISCENVLCQKSVSETHINVVMNRSRNHQAISSEIGMLPFSLRGLCSETVIAGCQLQFSGQTVGAPKNSQ